MEECCDKKQLILRWNSRKNNHVLHEDDIIVSKVVIFTMLYTNLFTRVKSYIGPDIKRRLYCANHSSKKRLIEVVTHSIFER